MGEPLPRVNYDPKDPVAYVEFSSEPYDHGGALFNLIHVPNIVDQGGISIDYNNLDLDYGKSGSIRGIGILLTDSSPRKANLFGLERAPGSSRELRRGVEALLKAKGIETYSQRPPRQARFAHNQ